MTTNRTRIVGLILLTAALLGGSPTHAQAQYYGYYPYSVPVNPWYGYFDSGAYLSGAASVYDAQGQYLIARQQAYLLREQARQARIETRRQMFNQRLYELEMMPSPEEVRELNRQAAVTQALNTPPETYILSGYTLNVLLTDLQLRHGRGERGPVVTIDPDVLRNLSLTGSVNQGDSGNLGLLKDAGQLQWPVLFTDPRFEPYRVAVDESFQITVREAWTSPASIETISELQTSLNRLQGVLVYYVHDVPMADFMPARHYLNQIQEAVDALQNPSLMESLRQGDATPNVRTVAELVAHLTENGLKFSTASAGQESAYAAVYQALASYDRQMSSGEFALSSE